jgi:hypothetical protein
MDDQIVVKERTLIQDPSIQLIDTAMKDSQDYSKSHHVASPYFINQKDRKLPVGFVVSRQPSRE